MKQRKPDKHRRRLMCTAVGLAAATVSLPFQVAEGREAVDPQALRFYRATADWLQAEADLEAACDLACARNIDAGPDLPEWKVARDRQQQVEDGMATWPCQTHSAIAAKAVLTCVIIASGSQLDLPSAEATAADVLAWWNESGSSLHGSDASRSLGTPS